MDNLDTAVISVGGKGTRFAPVSKSVPKPLYPLKKISCLERAIVCLSAQSISNIILLTCYKKELFSSERVRLEEKLGVKITIVIEDEPLGECGGLWSILNDLPDSFLFINGDLLWNIDIERLLRFHKSVDADVTLSTHITSHPEDSDLIYESNSGQITDYSLKPHDRNIKGMFLGNAGISLINKSTLAKLDQPKNKESWCHTVLQNIQKTHIKVFSYNTSEYIKDVGTPNRFDEAKQDVELGIVTSKSYRYKQRALFIDRDGTLIMCSRGEYITTHDKVVLIRRNIDAIKSLAIEEDITLCIMVTNQPQVAMGLCTIDDVIECNTKIINLCYKIGLKIDAFAICPHHPHCGYEDEVRVLKANCFCRKPSPGMLVHQAYLRNINLMESIMVGDSDADFAAANAAGVRYYNIDDLTTSHKGH